MTERSLFLALLDIEDPAQRRAYLDRASAGDPALRAQVEELLKAHQEPGDFLEHPAPRLVGNDEEPIRERPGAVIGPYKLLEQIGEGGFGIVFMAEQTQPVRRQVALKVLKPGMDTRQVVARFEAERQALALMDHPNIARVCDAGETASGRPYFVMELVRGVPITEFCDQNHLTVRERLALFVSVCQAVQHAHQKGVIHRDLKPSNLLVTLHDNKPVAKVIDFGIAKATGPKLTDKTLFTNFAQLIGTPLYMSPEQAQLSGLDIDTRSDVYSLGVLLYELLTGTTPFDRERLRTAAYDEIRRIIREEEPARPSSRISTLGQAAATVSVNRRSDPKRLSQLVRGELDWIVLKALEKDRNRRYETASAFAADVQRYLADEPVQAGPPGAGYRLRKFLKRHRVPVLAGTVVLLALVAGIIGTTSGLVAAWHQQDLTEQARQNEAEQRLAAVANAGRAKEEEGKAKKALERAEWLLYGSRINQAQQAWENNHAALAFHYLEACQEDFRGWEHDYLYTLFHSNQRTYGKQRSVRENHRKVTSVAVSPDGKRIVSGNYDKTVKVWDADTGQVILTFQNHRGSVMSVTFSPDGKRIVSGGYDMTVKVWDADTGQEILTCGGHTDSVLGVAFSPDGTRLVSGGSDQAVKVWDATMGRETLTLMGHTKEVTGVAFSPDGTRLVSGSADQTVKVWDAATGAEILPLRGHTGPVMSVAFSPDGKRLASGSADLTVKVWDPTTGAEILALRGHTGPVTSVAFSPDGRRLVSGSSWENTVRVWDAATGQLTRTFRGHTGQVSSVALMPDGRRIVSGSWDNTLKVWDADANQETRTLKGHTGSVRSVAFSPDGQRLVSGSWDQTVKVWDTATGQETWTLRGHRGVVNSVAFSPDGQRLVSGSWDQTVKVWNADTGQEIGILRGHTNAVYSVAFSPDGKRLVSGSWDGTKRLWDPATGQLTRTFRGQPNMLYSVAFSPDGKSLASGGSADGAVEVRDADTGEVILTLRGHTAPVNSVAFTPDGKRLVSGSADQTVKVWDAATGAEILALSGHTGPVSSVAVMPDGKRIVSGSHDQTVKLWDAETGHETLTLRGHTDAVNSVAVSPDGQRIVSGSTDGTVKVWEASRSQQKP
jgi:eukaryotic-like serine/threonine-protein kinase